MSERSDEIKAVFSEHGIETADDGSYRVPSSNGRSAYTVRFEGSPVCMEPAVMTWSCTCPAYKYGRTCRHITAVAAANDDVCNEFGYE